MELKLRLVQSLVGLRVAGLVGAARREPNALTYLPMHALVLPAYVLCMAWSMVCVGLHRARAWPVGPCAWSHHRPRTAPPEWRQALRVCPTQLFSSVTTGVILRNKGACFWQAVPACPGFATNGPPRALPWPVRPLVAWRASSPIEGASAPITSPTSDTATPHAAGVNPTASVTSSVPLSCPSPLAPTSSTPASADHEHDP
ncbi:hypothetical protein V6N13_007806 [Hibiscus sabdariffa]